MKKHFILFTLFLFISGCIETKLVNGEKKIDVPETIKSNSSLVVDGIIVGGMIAK